jgi:hypothetical protein
MSIQQVIITGALVHSYYVSLKPIYYTILFQGIQTCGYLFISFDDQITHNFLVNDLILTVTAAIFVVINTYLFCRLLYDMKTKAIVSFSTVFLILSCVITSNYDWNYTRTFDIVFIASYMVILSSLIIVFGKIQSNIMEELVAETKLHLNQQD